MYDHFSLAERVVADDRFYCSSFHDIHTLLMPESRTQRAMYQFISDLHVLYNILMISAIEGLILLL